MEAQRFPADPSHTDSPLGLFLTAPASSGRH
jgi:hypothetical protein